MLLLLRSKSLISSMDLAETGGVVSANHNAWPPFPGTKPLGVSDSLATATRGYPLCYEHENQLQRPPWTTRFLAIEKSPPTYDFHQKNITT